MKNIGPATLFFQRIINTVSESTIFALENLFTTCLKFAYFLCLVNSWPMVSRPIKCNYESWKNRKPSRTANSSRLTRRRHMNETSGIEDWCVLRQPAGNNSLKPLTSPARPCEATLHWSVAASQCFFIVFVHIRTHAHARRLISTKSALRHRGA